jgi:tetratricopeptide (TPR) repeat protein
VRRRPVFSLLALTALAACNPYRDEERLLLGSDPRAAAAAIHPRDARGHRLRAAALLAAGELAEARVEVRFALVLRPRDADAWMLLSRVERAAGHPAAALAAVEHAARRDPDRRDFDLLRAELTLGRGQALLVEGRAAAGERDLTLAVRLRPELAAQVEQARQAPPREALAAGPGDESAIDQTVRALAAQGAQQRAIETALDWAAAEPAYHRRAPHALGLLASIGQHAAAIDLGEALVAEDPGDPDARLLLARCYLVGGRPARAQQEIDEALFSSSDRPAILRRAAELYEAVGRRRQGCALLARSLSYGAQPSGLRALGECLQRDGQVEQARALLQQACALEGTCDQAAAGASSAGSR